MESHCASTSSPLPIKGPSAIGGRLKCCVSYFTALAAGDHAEYFLVYSDSGILADFAQKLRAKKRTDADNKTACTNQTQRGLGFWVMEAKDSLSPVHVRSSFIPLRSPFSREGSSSREMGWYLFAISSNRKTATHTWCGKEANILNLKGAHSRVHWTSSKGKE